MAIYSKNGKFLSTDAAHAGKLYIDDLSHPVNGITSDEFKKIASVVKQEGVTAEAIEYMCIAHTLFNEAGAVHKAMYTLAMSSYSSVPHKDALSDEDQSPTALYARAGVISAITGSADPTAGARFWDGIDFLAKGTSQGKFKQYRHISIPGSIYNSHKTALLAKYPHGVKFSGVKYAIPAQVFTDTTHWVNGDFEYETGIALQPKLIATAAAGLSIFWKIG